MSTEEHSSWRSTRNTTTNSGSGGRSRSNKQQGRRRTSVQLPNELVADLLCSISVHNSSSRLSQLRLALFRSAEEGALFRQLQLKQKEGINDVSSTLASSLHLPWKSTAAFWASFIDWRIHRHEAFLRAKVMCKIVYLQVIRV
jgi:hypothetical protein